MNSRIKCRTEEGEASSRIYKQIQLTPTEPVRGKMTWMTESCYVHVCSGRVEHPHMLTKTDMSRSASGKTNMTLVSSATPNLVGHQRVWWDTITRGLWGQIQSSTTQTDVWWCRLCTKYSACLVHHFRRTIYCVRLKITRPCRELTQEALLVWW